MQQYAEIYGDAYDQAAQAYEQFGADSGVDASLLPIGFAGCGTTAITAGSSATLTFELNMQMRPDRLEFDANAPNLLVSDIKVGAISLNASAGAAAGESFQHNTVGSLRGAVSGTPSVPVKVTVTSRSTATITVAATLKGPIRRIA